MLLVAQFAGLAGAVAELRESQRHAAQASAARAAAERLHAATCGRPGPTRPDPVRHAARSRRRARTAGDLTRLEYPAGLSTPRPASPGIPWPRPGLSTHLTPCQPAPKAARPQPVA